MHFHYPADICFACSKCGLCCGDTPTNKRHVLLLRSDVDRIATETNREISTFASEVYGKKPYLYEMHKNVDGKCVFLQENKCTLYAVRPLICRFYPFELTSDQKGFCTFRVTDECPGVCPGTIGVGEKLAEGYFRALLELARVELNEDDC